MGHPIDLFEGMDLNYLLFRLGEKPVVLCNTVIHLSGRPCVLAMDDELLCMYKLKYAREIYKVYTHEGMIHAYEQTLYYSGLLKMAVPLTFYMAIRAYAMNQKFWEDAAERHYKREIIGYEHRLKT